MKSNLKQIVVLIAFVTVATVYFFNTNSVNEISVDSKNDKKQANENTQNNWQSGDIITVNAQVKIILADDIKGDKHQKMILSVGTGTLLLAHNIDLAPRIPVKIGDSIIVRGEYEWNKKGGVIHWTHKDKRKKHEDGWIKFNGKIYN